MSILYISGSHYLLYHTLMWWLLCTTVLVQGYELLSEFTMLLNEKNRALPLLADGEWMWKLALYFSDLMKHVNELNLKLLGERWKWACVWHNTYIRAFWQKLLQLQSQVISQKVSWLGSKSYQNLNNETEIQIPADFATKTVTDLNV